MSSFCAWSAISSFYSLYWRALVNTSRDKTYNLRHYPHGLRLRAFSNDMEAWRVLGAEESCSARQAIPRNGGIGKRGGSFLFLFCVRLASCHTQTMGGAGARQIGATRGRGCQWARVGTSWGALRGQGPEWNSAAYPLGKVEVEVQWEGTRGAGVQMKSGLRGERSDRHL